MHDTPASLREKLAAIYPDDSADVFATPISTQDFFRDYRSRERLADRDAHKTARIKKLIDFHFFLFALEHREEIELAHAPGSPGAECGPLMVLLSISALEQYHATWFSDQQGLFSDAYIDAMLHIKNDASIFSAVAMLQRFDMTTRVRYAKQAAVMAYADAVMYDEAWPLVPLYAFMRVPQFVPIVAVTMATAWEKVPRVRLDRLYANEVQPYIEHFIVPPVSPADIIKQHCPELLAGWQTGMALDCDFQAVCHMLDGASAGPTFVLPVPGDVIHF